MFISNREINLEVLFDKKANCECLQWKFGYKDSKEAKEKYVRSKKCLLDGSLFPNTKAGRMKASYDRAEAIVKFEEEYKYTENSDKREATFEQYKNVFLEIRSKGYEKVSANTISNYDNAFRMFQELNNIKMKNIGIEAIKKIAYNAIVNGTKTSTIKAYFKNLSCMFTYASSVDKIIAPINLKEIKFKDEVTVEKEALSVADSLIVLEMFKEKRKKHYLVVYLALKLGMRLSEVLGLTWDCIDEVNQTIKINKQLKFTGLKEGSKDRIYSLNNTLKTVGSNREIYVSKTVLQEIKKYRTINPENRLFSFKNPSTESTMLSRHFTAFGFPNISAHNLRHTFVTYAHQHGMDYDEIGSYIGDNPLTVQKVYSHINGDSKANIKRIIEQIQ